MTNLDVMYSSKTDQWATPQEFFNELNAEFALIWIRVLMRKTINVRHFLPKKRTAF